jgi:hypothetical protein
MIEERKGSEKKELKYTGIDSIESVVAVVGATMRGGRGRTVIGLNIIRA